MTDKPNPPHPSPQARRVRNIGALRGISAEMAAVYRDAHARRIGWEEACKRVHVLATLGRLIEGGELERRIEALEEQPA